MINLIARLYALEVKSKEFEVRSEIRVPVQSWLPYFPAL